MFYDDGFAKDLLLEAIMLYFFRKYQKGFFFVITFAIVISFLFFGTYGTMSSTPKIENKPLCRGLGNQTIFQQDLNALCHLMSTSVFDSMGSDRKSIPNFLNDGVIERDFLATGLGTLLAKEHFDLLKNELQFRLEKIKHYRPYVHPAASQISFENISQRFSPTFLDKYQMLKSKTDQPTWESFALLSQVFLEQAVLPKEMLRQMLLMQQNQLGIANDPTLAQKDLSLFGFKTVQDWYGPRFITLAGQWILNLAQLAEKRGMEISAQEVKQELFKNIQIGFQHIFRKEQLHPEELEQYYRTILHHLGMQEETLISTWRKVMLSRRLTDEASQTIWFDPIACQQFEAFTKEGAQVELYEMQEPFQLTDFLSMLKCQLYLEAIAKDKASLRKTLHIPVEIAEIQEIEKRAPELVERKYLLEWTSISKAELAKQFSLKETWDWEVTDQNWILLAKQFPELASLKAVTKKERLDALDALESKLRLKVDLFAKAKMLDEHPEKILLALEQGSSHSKEIGIRSQGSHLPFATKNNEKELISLLEKAPLKGETPNAISQKLQFYTPDKEIYYNIHVIERAPEKRVALFKEVMEDQTLERLLDRQLEAAYPEVRKKEPRLFTQVNGEIKPYQQVKKEIGKILFADLLQTIQKQYQNTFGPLPVNAEDLPLNFYSNARFLGFIQDEKQAIEQGVEKEPLSPLLNQWQLKRSVQKIERCQSGALGKEALFTTALNGWSNIQMSERGNLKFYRVINRENPPAFPIESTEKAHQILAIDAKRDLFKQLLGQIQEKKAIDLHYSFTEDR